MVTENQAPAWRTALQKAAEQYAEYARAMSVPPYPVARAVPMASAANVAAPRGGRRVPAAQPGGGDHWRTDGGGEPIQPADQKAPTRMLVWPNAAPCLRCP